MPRVLLTQVTVADSKPSSAKTAKWRRAHSRVMRASSAWRVKRAGYESACFDGASVRHQASEVSPYEYMLNSLQAQILPRVVRSAPELRDMCLYKRYFVHKSSSMFLLFLAGAALVPKHRFALVLCVPWLRSV